MKYRKKEVIEAITFKEFVEYGKKNTNNIVDGMPWSFEYKGHGITHENDESYIIPTSEGSMFFTPKDMLITGINGEIYSCKIDTFEKTYEKVEIDSDEAWEIYVEKFRNKEFRMDKKEYYTLEKHGHLYNTDKILRQIFKDNFKGDESEVMGLVLMLQGHDCLYDTDKMLIVLRDHVERKDGLELLFNDNETRFTNIVEEVFIRL